jgi:carboxyl-terminal processing protease
MRKTRYAVILVTGIMLGLSLVLSSGESADRDSPSLPPEQAELFAEVLWRVKQGYVDSVTYEDLMEDAVRGMISGLDPHSTFLNEEEYREIRISTTGSYTGVGLEVSTQDEEVKVIAPFDGSPAALAGVLPGDIIIAIDDMPVDHTDLNATISLMRGRPGTHVSITILRGDDGDPIDFDLVRASIHVATVKHSLIEPDLGYIRITQFSETTGRDLLKSMRELREENGEPLNGLVLDLRNNPGGVLDAAVSVSDAFLDDGLIVSADGRSEESQFSMHARQGDVLRGGQLIVLVNGGSASASEIVAGALQDHHRAIIMGQQTFGKGSVQTVMPLSDGRAIKLTTSKYFTPSGSSIHNIGITPDMKIDDVGMPSVMSAASAELNKDLLAEDAGLQVALDSLRNRRILHSKAPTQQSPIKK